MRKKDKERNIDKYIMKHGGTFDDYQRCIENYMDYYDRRCRCYKVMYYTLSILKLICISSVPILELLFQETDANWGVVGVSALAILAESIERIFKAKEKWIEYRNTCDRMTQEQRKFKGKGDYYAKIEEKVKREQEYIERIEGIIGKENTNWKEYMEKQKQNEN